MQLKECVQQRSSPRALKSRKMQQVPHAVLFPPSTTASSSAIVGCITMDSLAPQLHAFTLALARSQVQQNFILFEEPGQRFDGRENSSSLHTATNFRMLKTHGFRQTDMQHGGPCCICHSRLLSP